MTFQGLGCGRLDFLIDLRAGPSLSGAPLPGRGPFHTFSAFARLRKAKGCYAPQAKEFRERKNAVEEDRCDPVLETESYSSPIYALPGLRSIKAWMP